MASEENCSLQDFYLSVPQTTPTDQSTMVTSTLERVKHFMEEFDNVMNDIFSGGDPMMSQWFLVKNNYMPFLLCVFYVVFCTVIGPAFMRNREPFDLRRLMILFNFSLVAIYICSIISAIIYLPKATWYEFCIRIEVEGHPIYPLAVMGWFIYIIKYVEFFDTVFFILRKKENQLSFLHIFHHAVVPVMGWAFIRTESNCVEAIPVIANNIVHIIMYTYYGLAAMGPQLQKYLWWKKYLTQLQMAQFLFMIVFLSVIVPLMGCRLVKMVYVAFTGMISTFLYLFYQFYRANFQKKNV